MIPQTEQFTVDTLEPILGQYFQAFNCEDYDAVAALFHRDGILRPPFEESLVGAGAICTYLKNEAQGMRATPLESDVTCLENRQRQIIVKGRVKALVFIVNVQWTFLLSDDDTILDAHIKLLASLQELMQINRGDQATVES